MTDKTHFGFERGRARGEGAARARRVRLGGGQLRPHERPHVGGPAPAVEALRGRRDRRARRACACSTSPAGTGDLARLFARNASAPPAKSCSPTSTARCSPQGRDKLLNAGRARPDRPVRRRAACRSPTARFDCVSIAFGLRNVTRKEAALAEMRRVLRPAASPPCSSSRASGSRSRPPTTGTAST